MKNTTLPQAPTASMRWKVLGWPADSAELYATQLGQRKGLLSGPHALGDAPSDLAKPPKHARR
eukprot:13539360-Alexandrium_andersonii.AAC.1